jgi:hypothetical protein
MDSCYNCGLPEDCALSEGYKLRLTFKAKTAYGRDSKRTVWCHSEECTIQALAVALYGPSSHKWPVTLAQFRATRPLDGLDRAETIAEPRVNTGAPEALVGILDPEHGAGVSVRFRASKRIGGRPRKWASEAERMRAYRCSTTSSEVV